MTLSESIAAFARKGYSCKEIMDAVGCSRSLVYRTMHHHGTGILKKAARLCRTAATVPVTQGKFENHLITVPASIVRGAGMAKESQVALRVVEGKIVIERIKKTPGE